MKEKGTSNRGIDSSKHWGIPLNLPTIEFTAGDIFEELLSDLQRRVTVGLEKSIFMFIPEINMGFVAPLKIRKNLFS